MANTLHKYVRIISFNPTGSVREAKTLCGRYVRNPKTYMLPNACKSCIRVYNAK